MSKFYEINAIREFFKGRIPFNLLDRAWEIDENDWVGIKNVTMNEEFFNGHFPNHPIMPGVLQLEAMKQLAELAVREKIATADTPFIRIAKIAKVKFRRPALPGDRLKITVEITSVEGNTAEISAKTESAGGVVSDAKFTLQSCAKAVSTEKPEIFNEYDVNDNVDMNNDKIMQYMPHRYPFLLIDYIPENRGENVLAVKNISANEPFFANMDEDMAVPVSLLCEMGAQAGCASILARPENEGKLGYFMSIDGAESFAPVMPGDQLVIRFNLPAGKSRFGKGSGEMLVNGKVVFKVTLMFALVDK
ncbi:MAG: 3-hydroxyacyl-ACP dehydratase FabZ [Lentisphaeria bacterium]|nr:3-hydroxyacyl-ACP dehydratase FabZ [Lentisphaeria bacterium]